MEKKDTIFGFDIYCDTTLNADEWEFRQVRKPTTTPATPHTIPDLKKQLQEEYENCKDINNPEWLDSVVDRTLAFAKEATLLEEQEETSETHTTGCDMDASHGYVLTHEKCSGSLDDRAVGFNAARQAQLKKWEKI